MIVEGYEDLHTVVHLMKRHVIWPDDKSQRPVEISIGSSVDEILNRSYLYPKLKQSGLKRLGIMFDADADLAGRWNSLRSLVLEFFPSIPDQLPQEGLVVDSPDGQRLGVWIMPDNKSSGMLETFLRYLVPAQESQLWDAAKCSAEAAKAKGAIYISAHTDKANIHTWLAWQNPPGERFGLAITKSLLDSNSLYARPFVDWFINLFELGKTS